MPQKQISVTIDIPEWANFVAQDNDGYIYFYNDTPELYFDYWNADTDAEQLEIAFTTDRILANWQNSKIDLRENDFEIVNGELVAIPKMEENWLPINTAPKDGTKVELKNVNNGLRDVGCWCDYLGRGAVSGSEGEWSQELGNGDMTHWRPKMPVIFNDQA